MKIENYSEIKFHSLGATQIIAYLYFRLVDPDYMGWKTESTSMARCNQIKRNRSEVFGWLLKVLQCSPKRLAQNELGLSYDEIIRMTNAVLDNWDENF